MKMIFLVRGEVHRGSVANKEKKENMAVGPSKYGHQRDTYYPGVLLRGLSELISITDVCPHKH